ncbi:MAG: hypothetical protein Q9203_001732 [Teloschistes exilis]
MPSIYENEQQVPRSHMTLNEREDHLVGNDTLLRVLMHKSEYDHRGIVKPEFSNLTPMVITEQVLERYNELLPTDEDVDKLARNFRGTALTFVEQKIMSHGFSLPDVMEKRKEIDYCLCGGWRWKKFSKRDSDLVDLGKRIVKICDLYDQEKFAPRPESSCSASQPQ